MFGKKYVRELINRSAENAANRLRFLRAASAAGLGLVGAGLLRSVATPVLSGSAGEANAISDSAILNFALNLEYLEAEYYSYAVHGHGLPEDGLAVLAATIT
jgi:ferritin-like protein